MSFTFNFPEEDNLLDNNMSGGGTRYFYSNNYKPLKNKLKLSKIKSNDVALERFLSDTANKFSVIIEYESDNYIKIYKNDKYTISTLDDLYNIKKLIW